MEFRFTEEQEMIRATAQTFLAQYRRSGPQNPVSKAEIGALFKSLWLLGFRYSGRRQYWRFLAHTLLSHPRMLAPAITLAIYGHHFRRIAQTL